MPSPLQLLKVFRTRTRIPIGMLMLAGFLGVSFYREWTPTVHGGSPRIEDLEGRLPSQSHAMEDVAYHYAGLWFAAQKENWPLADFYLGETRQHLHWAVNILPVRKDPEGDPVDLRAILQGIETTQLAWIEQAIQNQDRKRFDETYRLMAEACYACHKASGKPYLRPKIPENQPEPMLEYGVEVDWPK